MSVFAFASTEIDSQALRDALLDPAAGGYASFEGWVRNHNEGQPVTQLEYEAFEALAVSEGERIVAEAQRRFGILHANCVHRIGRLAIGDMAVWVGVSSRHRAEAFAACRYIIDEVKHRLPIWKKEHYANGDSGWVNCERCAEHASEAEHVCHAHEHEHVHTHAERSHDVRVDYSRQIALQEVGPAGQERLSRARVLIVGAGGLGVPVLSYLAGAGIGTLGIADGDVLEASNLPRQTLYALADVGTPKAELAARKLRALNPEVMVQVHAQRVDTRNVAQLIAQYDLIVDCSDNFSTKFLLNDAAVLAGKPVVFASVYQYEGQLHTYRPDRDGACMRCIWPQATRDGLVGNCAEAGVLGPVPGVLGSLQALEALKILLDLPGQLHNELLILDLLTFTAHKVRAPRTPECEGVRCVHISSAQLAREEQSVDLSFAALETAVAQGFRLVDIRDPREINAAAQTLPACERIEMTDLLEGRAQLDSDVKHLIVCARGLRSHAVAKKLRELGARNVYSLQGGVAALSR